MTWDNEWTVHTAKWTKRPSTSQSNSDMSLSIRFFKLDLLVWVFAWKKSLSNIGSAIDEQIQALYFSSLILIAFVRQIILPVFTVDGAKTSASFIFLHWQTCIGAFQTFLASHAARWHEYLVIYAVVWALHLRTRFRKWKVRNRLVLASQDSS